LPRSLARQTWFAAAFAVAALAVATALIAVLEGPLDVSNASPVYLVAVVSVAALFGTWPALAVSVAAFLLYDLLFVEPRFTLTVADPHEWLNLVLFLFVAAVIGRLTAVLSERATEAARRARESQALFGISRILATATTVDAVAPAVLARLAADSRMSRLWIALSTGTGERTLADTRPGTPIPRPTVYDVLVRTPGDEPARWLRTHVRTESTQLKRAIGPGSDSGADRLGVFRVKIEVDGEVLGSVWASRSQAAGPPTREETRLLSLAADQLALGLRRDRLSSEATAAEIARESDALKSALLDSVSHDLRTPLASIRAAAGSLMDPSVAWSADDMRRTARAIDGEAERLNRLVRNILDLSRIEGGALRPDLEVFDLGELVEPIVRRLQPLAGTRAVEIAIGADLPPVEVDAIFLDEVVTNLLENAMKYGGPQARIRVSATARTELAARVILTVEDNGPGVPPDAMPHLFEKFYRVTRRGEGSRRGLGIGLSVVKGLTEAMGGRVVARRGELGGLAIDLDLAAAVAPVDEPAVGAAHAGGPATGNQAASVAS